jgi:hypothetical protein
MEEPYGVLWGLSSQKSVTTGSLGILVPEGFKLPFLVTEDGRLREIRLDSVTTLSRFWDQAPKIIFLGLQYNLHHFETHQFDIKTTRIFLGILELIFQQSSQFYDHNYISNTFKSFYACHTCTHKFYNQQVHY